MVIYVCSPQASAPTGAALRVDGGVVVSGRPAPPRARCDGPVVYGVKAYVSNAQAVPNWSRRAFPETSVSLADCLCKLPRPL
jgi:hypothetical protein